MLGACALLAAALWCQAAATQPVEVPLRLQAELLAKVAAYDREFAARARGRALVFVVVKANDAGSQRVAEQLSAELGVLEQIGGLPHAEETIRYASPAALAELCKNRMPAIVYLSTGFSEEIGSIAQALEGQSILSVGAVASYVPKRMVLGFDSESGKPKLLVHLDQARRQRVAFKPELLALARVIQ
jgi:hypothetical protein